MSIKCCVSFILTSAAPGRPSAHSCGRRDSVCICRVKIVNMCTYSDSGGLTLTHMDFITKPTGVKESYNNNTNFPTDENAEFMIIACTDKL